LLFRQLASSEHSRDSCGSGKTVEVFGKVKDRFFLAPRSVNCPATSRACSARSSHSKVSFKIDGILIPPFVGFPAMLLWFLFRACECIRSVMLKDDC
jgi:hypothetical protein